MSPSSVSIRHGNSELPLVTISEASRLLSSGELSAAELLGRTLNRLQLMEPHVHAFVRVMAESAWRDAERADREIGGGRVRSPLHGIPIAVKDMLHVRGVPTEAGSRMMAGFVPSRDAVVVDRLRRAGAVLIGKTVTHEFAYGQDVPLTRNAWNQAHLPGGSSAGSAVAVAVGSAYGAIGTDTAGSIRIPASLNGVVGLKPTHGLVSHLGVLPMSPSLDAVGPMARTVEDCALVLQAIAGSSADDPSVLDKRVPAYADEFTSELHGLTLGVERRHFFSDGVAQEVGIALEAAIQQMALLGARIVEVEIEHLEYAAPAGWTVLLADASEWHSQLLRRRGDHYVEGTRVLLEVGEMVLATSYIRAQRVRRLIQGSVRRTFEHHSLDALIAPTTPLTAPVVEGAGSDARQLALTPLWGFLRHAIVANVTGMPAITLPCGLCREGLPIGMQLLGRPFDESALLRIGNAFQLATDWHKRHPTVIDGL